MLQFSVYIFFFLVVLLMASITTRLCHDVIQVSGAIYRQEDSEEGILVLVVNFVIYCQISLFKLLSIVNRMSFYDYIIDRDISDHTLNNI